MISKFLRGYEIKCFTNTSVIKETLLTLLQRIEISSDLKLIKLFTKCVYNSRFEIIKHKFSKISFITKHWEEIKSINHSIFF